MDSDKKRGRPTKRHVPGEAVYPCEFCTRDEETCRWRLCKDYRTWTKEQWRKIKETFKKGDSDDNDQG